MTINYGTTKGTNEHGLYELRMSQKTSQKVIGHRCRIVLVKLTKDTVITYRQELRDMTDTYSTVPLTDKGVMDETQIT